MKKSLQLIGALITAPLTLAMMAGCASGDGGANGDSGSGEHRTIHIGTTEGSEPYWEIVKEKASAEGIDVEVENFTDYPPVNRATTSGELDLNIFQHLAYLATYNVESSADLVPIAATYVVPLNLYSQKHAKVDEIPEGGTIAVPNDASNQARALLVLQDAGLLKLKDGGTIFSTPNDIEDGSKVKVEAVSAEQTVQGLGSIDGAVINNSFLEKAGIDPASAISTNDPAGDASKPYINVIVTRAEDASSPEYEKVVSIFNSDEVRRGRLEATKNTAISVDLGKDELKAILDDLETQIRNKR